MIGGRQYHNDSHSTRLHSSACDDESTSNLQQWHQLIGCFGGDSTGSLQMGPINRKGDCAGDMARSQEAMLGSKESTNYISNMVAEEEENKQKNWSWEAGSRATST